MTDPVVISHEGYLEILITALGVVAALFSLLMALLGFIGYTAVKRGAVQAARKAATQKTREIIERQVRENVDDRIKIAVAAAIREERAQLHLEEQAYDLSRGQVEEAGPEKRRDMNNVLIRPVKRVVSDSYLRRDEP